MIVLLVLLAFAIAAVLFTIVVVVVVDRSAGDTRPENRGGPVGRDPGEEQRD